MKKLEQAKMKNVYIDLASFVITVNEDYTTNREQKLNYPLLTLVSDIGGAAKGSAFFLVVPKRTKTAESRHSWPDCRCIIGTDLWPL